MYLVSLTANQFHTATSSLSIIDCCHYHLENRVHFCLFIKYVKTDSQTQTQYVSHLFEEALFNRNCIFYKLINACTNFGRQVHSYSVQSIHLHH